MPSSPCSFRRRVLVPLLVALAAFGVQAHATTPPAPPGSTSHSAREVAARAKLAAVRAEIAKMAAAERATSARRGSINAKLAKQANQLDQIAHKLHESDAALAEKSAAITKLEQQRSQLETRLARQRAALAALLKATYILNQGSNLSLLLGGHQLAKTDRALAYSRYFQRDRMERIHALLASTAKLDQVKASLETEAATLQQQRKQRAAQAVQLQKARAAQQSLLARADQQLTQQHRQLAALQRDAKALDQLLKRLQNVFADIPPKLGKTTPFAQLRGKLVWPVAGRVHQRAGSPEHGLVIAARPGTVVHAVAYGRVAWADYMRGFGILVIVDQGGGWMSLYGGNESAEVEAGDWVRPGQPIATVGPSPVQGGAWFGLRHDGKPVDPRGWFSGKR